MPEAFELLVEVTRNKIVESRHFGAAVVCDHKGNMLESWGDAEQLVFPRSALKPMLAIDLVESGASARFKLSETELALACASHQGEAIHREAVENWLRKLGLTPDDLACGKALSDDPANLAQALTSGQPRTRSYHNCSGKHTAYLTTALHLGLPTDSYHHLDHPLQQRSLDILSDLAGVDIRQFPAGIDGCGVPAPTMPLKNLAIAIARYAKPDELSDSRAQAIITLHKAMAAKPFYIAGHGTSVSDICVATKGAILPKSGAEGILIAAVPGRGLGIALKIADGSARGRATALLAILDHIGALSQVEKDQLQAHISPQLRNSRDELVGEIRPASSWLGG